MAFYRPMPTIGYQHVKDLNLANVAHLSKHEVALMFEQRPMAVWKLTRTTGKNTQNIEIVEGTFVKNKNNQSFLSKAMLRPKLITATSTPIRRKKADSDIDYVPDNDEDTQDTEEDVILEKTTVPEHPKKRLNFTLIIAYIICCYYKARHAHKHLYMVLPKYSKIQVLPGITSCRLMKYNKQAIELNSLLINNMPKDGYE